MSDGKENEAQKQSCGQRCSTSLANCRNSRTGAEWRRLIGAYLLFYIFISAWMASLMTIYMQTRPPQCTFQNGNYCIGEPRIMERIRARISQKTDQVKATYWCNSTASDKCFGTSLVRLNAIWPLRQLGEEVSITCTLLPKPELSEIDAYQLEADFPPLKNTSQVSVHCADNAPVPEALIQFVGPEGNLGGRSCSENATAQSVTFTYAKGATAPYYQEMTTVVPAGLVPAKAEGGSSYDTARYVQLLCEASSGAATMAEFDTTSRWPSHKMHVTLAFAAFGDDVTEGKPEERSMPFSNRFL